MERAQTVGLIEGQFTMTRTPIAKLPADLSDASLGAISTSNQRPRTLYSCTTTPSCGVRFLYPRGWRVGAVQGKQVTLDHAARRWHARSPSSPPRRCPARRTT